MNIEGLPFKVTEETIRHLHADGNNSDVFEFYCNGRLFVIKEAKLTSEIYLILGNDPYLAARLLNQIYGLAKKHYGERLSETMFIVAKNRRGAPAVVTVQAKVEGRSLNQVINEGGGTVALLMHEKADEYGDLWDKVVNDRGWKKLPSDVRRHYRKHDMHIDNIFLTPDGRFIAIDF